MEDKMVWNSFFRTLIIVSTSGCLAPIARNTGATDYAVARDMKGDKCRCDDSECHCKTSKLNFLPKYRDANSNAVIEKDQSISINLQYAFIEDFSERWERFTSGLQFTKVRGEIAILANVYEANGSEGQGLSYGTKFKDGARLIYYSDDVRSGGQPLNFSSIPVYGPVTYNGGPIVIELAILELDLQEATQVKGLLSQLAELGKIAYAPTSPELKILDLLGKQFLEGEQDDWEFSYKFLLYPSSSGNSQLLKTAVLEVGNYVLINRQVNALPNPTARSPYPNFSWNDYKFDPKTGKVKYCGKESNRSDELLDNTYLVLQINNNKFPSGNEFKLLQTFRDFQKDIIDQIKTSNDEKRDAIKEVVTAYAKEVQEAANNAIINKQLSSAVSLINEFSAAHKNKEPGKKNILSTQLYNILVEKIGVPKQKDGKTPMKLSASQRQNILAELYKIVKDPANIKISLSKTDIKNATAFRALLLT